MVSRGAQGFHFEPGGIGGILRGNRLKVPTFQREYSWETNQVDQLLNDFHRAKLDHSDYFLGTIVTIAKGTHEPLEIVDGQQRLTTTAILITAIREVMKEIGQPEAVIESINNDYLSSYDRKAGEHVPKLTLNIDDNDFFSELLRGNKPKRSRDSHDRLQDAFQNARSFMRKVVSTFAEVDKPTVLNEWLEFIEHEASVILVKTDDAAKAFKMFETLNDRGLKTSQADLVKSYLFGQAGKRVGEAQSRWSSMKDNLEELKDDESTINFLRHNLIATKQFVRAEDIYSSVQSGVRGETSSASFISSLEASSRVYVSTYQESSEYWSSYPTSSQKALEVYNKFDLKPSRPLVFALAIKFKPNEFDKAISLVSSLIVRLVLASRTRSGVIEQTFANAALNVYEGKITTTDELKKLLTNVIVSDLDFRNEFQTARVTKADLARYYLRTLENANAGDKEPWFIVNEDSAILTLEHVLPQNPVNGWHFDADVRKLYTKRLGNLCLLQKSGNELIGNKSYAEKKSSLFESPLKMTSMIAENSTWGPEQIEERQTKLADIAIKAWPV